MKIIFEIPSIHTINFVKIGAGVQVGNKCLSSLKLEGVRAYK